MFDNNFVFAGFDCYWGDLVFEATFFLCSLGTVVTTIGVVMPAPLPVFWLVWVLPGVTITVCTSVVGGFGATVTCVPPPPWQLGLWAAAFAL